MKKKQKKKKYKIVLSTEPPKRKYTDEEIKNTVNKAVNLIIDELIVNEHIKI